MPASLCEWTGGYEDSAPDREIAHCTGCEVELVAGEERMVRRKPWCAQHALVEQAQLASVLLDTAYTPTEAELDHADRALAEIEELIREADERLSYHRAARDREQARIAREVGLARMGRAS